MDWTVTIEAVGPPDAGPVGPDVGDSLADALPGAVGWGSDNRYGATFKVIAPSVWQAFERATGQWRRIVRELWLPGWPLERLDLATVAEHDREATQRSHPELFGLAEIAGLLGMSRVRADEVARQVGFPVPVAKLESGPVWAASEVRAFRQKWSEHIREAREGVVQIVYYDHGWRVRRNDEVSSDAVFTSRAAAIATARDRVGSATGAIVVEEPGGAVTNVRIVRGEVVQRDEALSGEEAASR